MPEKPAPTTTTSTVDGTGLVRAWGSATGVDMVVLQLRATGPGPAPDAGRDVVERGRPDRHERCREGVLSGDRGAAGTSMALDSDSRHCPGGARFPAVQSHLTRLVRRSMRYRGAVE